jgi:hypothetical protein
MKILSIDIGIKNMGICLIEFDEILYNLNNLTTINDDKHNYSNLKYEVSHIHKLNELKGLRKPKTSLKKKCKLNKLDKLCFTKIIDWRVFNILDNHINESTIYNNKCEFSLKNGKQCSSNAIYYNEIKTETETETETEPDIKYHYFCKKHSKQVSYFTPQYTYTKSTLQNKNITQLLELKKEHSIFFGENNDIEHKLQNNIKILKTELVNELYDYIKTHKLKLISKPKSRDISLIEIGIIITKEFDKWLSDELIHIDKVIIENQISPIANRMKTIQGMITQYFIMKNITNIEFISSSNKLNNEFQNQLTDHIFNEAEFGKQTNKISKIHKENVQNITGKQFYKERKNAGLELAYKVLKIMETYHYHTFIEFYESHKKKDDLADSLLQGIWYIYNL